MFASRLRQDGTSSQYPVTDNHLGSSVNIKPYPVLSHKAAPLRHASRGITLLPLPLLVEHAVPVLHVPTLASARCQNAHQPYE